MNAGLRRHRAERRPAGVGRAELAARFPEVIGLGLPPEAVARRFHAWSVVVVGCGAVGRVAAAAVARCHPRRLVVVDPKPITATTPLTGLLATAREVGLAKAEVVAREIADVAPECEVREFAGPVQDLPLPVWLEADVVLLCADNLGAELFVGERCLRLGIPLVLGNVHGASWVAQVRTFGNRGEEAPCPGCGYGAEEWALAAREVRFPCDGAGGDVGVTHVPPTRTPVHIAALGGILAANQSLRLWLGLGAGVADTQLEFCGLSHRSLVTPLRRRPTCRVEHAPRWERRALPGDAARLSFAALAAAAGFVPGAGGLLLTVDGRGFVGRGHCRCAGAAGEGNGRPVHRFFPRPAPPTAGLCAECRGPMLIPPYEWRESVSAADLGPGREWSLRRLGAGPRPTVLLGDGERTVVLVSGHPA